MSQRLVEALISVYGENVTRKQILDWAIDQGESKSLTLRELEKFKTGRGKYTLIDYTDAQRAEIFGTKENTFILPEFVPMQVQTEGMTEAKIVSFVPNKDKNFIPFGNYKDVHSIVRSGIFYPVYITGLSGNGKTHSVEQSCATLGRELIRVNITIETDEDDLLGGFRLEDGNTVWHDGPVIEAMNRGAILLLDEIDLASNKIMCLQSILEGNGVYLKKVNRKVEPQPGFNVFATANTKGRGSADGKFFGTNPLNEAFLERFAVTFEQDYPSQQVESKILMKNLESYGEIVNRDSAEQLVADLTSWAKLIRDTYTAGGVDDVISTRRLINVIKAYVIWGKITKAIELCIARFDDDTAKSFREFFEKIYRVPQKAGQPATQAVKYTDKFLTTVRIDAINQALIHFSQSNNTMVPNVLRSCFDFTESPEGPDYWRNLFITTMDTSKNAEISGKLSAILRAKENSNVPF